MLWDGTYCFSSLSKRPRKKKPFAEVITKVALSSQLFKDPECWSSQSLNPWLTTRQTSTLPTKLTRRWFSVTVRLTSLIWSLKGSVHEIETTLKTFTFNIQLYIMDQGVSTTFRILSLTTVRGLMPVLFHRYNVKQSSLESTSNLKTILSMYKVLPVSTSVFFPSYRWRRSVSNEIMTRYQILMNGCKKKLAV